jgi:cysteine synthase
MVFDNILDMIGNTPIAKLNIDLDYDVEIFLKLEGQNPSGSVKDRAVKFIILNALAHQNLTPHRELIDVSSGNFGCALALVAKSLGYKATVITGAKLTPDKEFYIKYFDARLIKQPGFTCDGIKLVEQIMAEAPDKYYFLDQLHNPFNPLAHYQTTGPEILKDLPDVSAVVFTAGSSGTLAGMSKFFKEKSANTRIIATFAGHGSAIPGAGAYVDGEYKTPFFNEMYHKNWIDSTFTVGMEQVHHRLAQLQSAGFFVGLSTAAALEAAFLAIKELNITGKVVVISGDSGWKYIDNYKKQ